MFSKWTATQRHLSLCLAIAVAALPILAFETPEDGPLRNKTMAQPELYIGSYYFTEAQLITRDQSGKLAPLARLGVENGGAFMDPRSGRWGTLMPATPLLPGLGNTLSWRSLNKAAPGDMSDLRATAWGAYRSWLEANAEDLGLDLSELGQEKVTAHRGSELIQIHVPRVKDGLRVRDSYLHAVISHGNLVLWGAVKWGDIRVSSTPNLDAPGALQSARNHVAGVDSDLQWRKPELMFLPVANGADPRAVEIGRGYDYRLVWSWRGETPNETGEWEALVDAHDGGLLAFADKAHYFEGPENALGAPTTREVQGGVYPVSNDGANPDGINQTFPIPFAYLTQGGDTHVSDSGGNVGCIDGSLNTALEGPYVVITDNCGAVNESSSAAVFDLGSSGGIDCTTPAGAMSAGNTHSSRSGFYEINRSMEIGRSYLPENTWLQSPLPVEMNINLTCNATGGPGGLRFYRSGGGCSNTGEIAGVFVHEWGHGMDGADANPGISNPGEGIADIYAALRLNASCMGRNFRTTNCTGFGDACTDCTGVRDIDWAKRVSGQPHGIAFIDSNCEFPNDGNAAPCNGSVHCEGAVAAESVWDLWKRDLPGTGMDAETAYRLTTRLTFEGAGATGQWYTCVDGAGTGDGCNADGAYLNYLAADDDDGNLNNGTPHMASIFAAFDRHDIACPTPTVQESGCANRPSIAPTVATSPFDRGATLTWGAVADAATYRVYRTEGVFGCDFGKKYLGETTGLSFVDEELKNGMEYYYVVVPVGAGGASCLGPASSCASVTPVAGANMAVSPGTESLSISSGDADQFLDSCEQATLSFDVSNIGTGNLTNARIVSVTSPSHPGIDFTLSGFSIDNGSLGSCGIGVASFDFMAVDVAFADTIVFEVEVTSDELSPRTVTGTLQVNDLESNFQNFASKTFDFESATEGWVVNRGTFSRSGAVGGAGGTSTAMNSSTLLDGQCDRIRSPIFVPTASTMLTAFTNYEIEDFGGQWWDRANLSTIDGSGTRAVRTPDGGRAYDAAADSYGACNSGEVGWAGTTSGNSWAASTWSAGALGSAGLSGQQSRLEFVYGTDGAAVERGFAFDRVILTNVDLQVEDDQPNCAILPIFTDGFENGDVSAWSSNVGFVAE